MFIGKRKVNPSIITKMDRSERKMDVREKGEGGNPHEGSLDMEPQCQALSKALAISRTTI